jgi:hypothetical protein
MKKPSQTTLADQLHSIHDVLSQAAFEAECAIEKTQSCYPPDRFRQKVAMDVLQYVVRLDMAMADIHKARQTILEAQVEEAGSIN